MTETTPGKLDYVRLLYDNAYNIIVVIILLNIVQGIIIDTFGEVREKNKYNEHDRLTKCFICGLERDYIERITDRPFKYHIYNEHNEWNYVLYIAYILNKDQEEYSGIERYIRELYDLKDIRWLPSNQGLSINK